MPDGPQTSPQTSADAEPVKRVLAAVKAEGGVPIERVHVFMTSGNIADEYYIDRVNPGRFRDAGESPAGRSRTNRSR